MTNQNKTVATSMSVEDFIKSIPDEKVTGDCRVLINLMEKVSSQPAVMWGPNIVGFGTYHYKYESGREGDMAVIGFSPRKDKITVYVVDGTDKYSKLLADLGKYKLGKVCIYIKSLTDINLSVLEQILMESFKYTKSLDGEMHRA